MNYPKLSIITINLNNALGLEKTIKSIAEQSYTDYEYIVIDGNSTDRSVDIIQKYTGIISNWVSEPDKGIYTAMNKGILKSKGKFLLFLNSGDYLCNKFVLEKMLVNEIDCDLIYGNLIRINDNGKKIKDIGHGGNEISFFTFFSNTINHPTSFINRRLFDKYGLYDDELKIVSDWKFFLVALGLNTAKIEYKNIDVAFFEMGGISSTQPEILKFERDKVLNELIPIPILNDYKVFEFDWVRISQIRKNIITAKLYRISQIFLLRLSKLISKFNN